MSETSKAVLVGTGNVARIGHIPALKAGSKTEIAAVVDPSPAALAAVQQEIPHAKIFTSIEEVPLNQIDVAIICSPSAFHFEQADFFLEKGLHVLCEKPLATKTAHAQALSNKARQKGVVLQAGFNRRYQAVAKFLKDAVEGGKYGPLVSVSVRAGSIARDLPPAILNPAISGGGVLMDYGIHFIDRLCSWFPALEVEEYEDDYEGGIEVNAHIKLAASNKLSRYVPVNVFLSWTSEMGDSFALEFPNVTLRCSINNGKQISVLTQKKQTTSLKNIYRSDIITLPDSGNIMQLQWNDFLRRIAGGPETVSSLDDAVRATSIVEMCYANRKKLQLSYGY
jgi:predicted dehydrogenase